ncbi:hypothetical protein P43SY_006723 [Pythium insidiosum]|uniref:subtilisin n=1 Tax=Pythium insidiosum TaxID=114742 RepID=A0AAD5QCP8_PYTIN|nr:hypothetical protein P43SY_006723 [Pythium insidiosum]
MKALAIGAAAALAVATGDARRMQQVEQGARVVHGAHAALWRRRERADPSSSVTFRLVLATHKSEKELDAVVQAVSDVSSAQYGKFLGLRDVQHHWRPHADAEQALVDALARFQADATNELHVLDPVRDSARVRMSVATAEKIFQTALYEFEHRSREGVRVIRPQKEYVLPPEIADHVVFVDGLEAFPTPGQAQLMARRARARGDPDADHDPFAVTTQDSVAPGDVLVTPQRIRDQYGIPDDAQRWNGSHPKNKLVISAFLKEFYAEADLKQFLDDHEPDAAVRGALTYPAHRGDCLAGEATRHGATGEASLDVQVAVSLTRSDNIEVLCYQDVRDPTRPFADDNQEPFLTFMQTVNAMEPAPAVVSVSYTDEECAVPRGYLLAVNREFQKAAARGTTVLISSGDAGVQGSHMTTFCGIESCSRFVAMFPASSPYVTSVGATSLKRTRDPAVFDERVTSAADGALITSGGGFSAIFEQPPYQRDAVRSYLLSQRKDTAGMFNARGRAYPDISALGHAFPVHENGKVFPTDGTSVSTPVVASMVALLNRQRLDRGQSVLGFLNPLLYKLQTVCPHVFNDITEGDLRCGSPSKPCCKRGFTAEPGWDAASGVGTIRFAVLARDLDDCIAKLQAQAGLSHEPPAHISLLQADMTLATRRVEQVGLAMTLMAMVSLLGVLFALRDRLFPSQRFLARRPFEPARERLLADDV